MRLCIEIFVMRVGVCCSFKANFASDVCKRTEDIRKLGIEPKLLTFYPSGQLHTVLPVKLHAFAIEAIVKLSYVSKYSVWMRKLVCMLVTVCMVSRLRVLTIVQWRTTGRVHKWIAVTRHLHLARAQVVRCRPRVMYVNTCHHFTLHYM